ncbi:protein serine/threonine phosphatase 2C [Wallemia mellicola CBS 633.66]|uniref:Protein serine/threonine phosphatase 2C n=2 Tax=Wallemia mellicola TaxID=1708541 RepID=I4YF87_WALMC|nr:protein serine/threonine phosphatase 2C [Wallemia mellicola CBS 633.66]TIB75684.1 hypothetical protein E3Q23_02288 [Wallemia mellicola]EIM22629.1 protein serine/threonine phosphatase 2C [Wallemia mellicola CBS 633.66]TIB97673.1 protein serine/threonine phosphatase 2C [Wallemia mellicola]TIC12479.1 protein serine/threonine phosphatase 2C [Wallemia mellicola]TIC27409.1 protein serine/threonine phosphatase 2C [Wallemia mellicola]|eukprot:XP_006957295.1 protein serine/threonine phosphatase 2C [Wallemia mellicola CBS 633.66]
MLIKPIRTNFKRINIRNYSIKHQKRSRIIDILLFSSASLGLYALYSHFSHNQSLPLISTNSFTIPTKNKDGIPTITTIKKLSSNAINQLLRANESATSINRPGSSLIKEYHNNSISSNNPIEDRSSQIFLERDFKPKDISDFCRKGDLYFFCVFDGHSGFKTSDLLSKSLIPFTVLHLSSLFNNIQPTSSNYFDNLKNKFLPINFSNPLDSQPKFVIQAIKNAFISLDNALLQAPINTLNQLPKTISPPKSPDESLLSVLSGSCALMAYFDELRQDLYIALTGDSRAVAGYYENGKWRVEVLTNDQTGKSKSEIQRIQSEHPSAESPYVIQRGRVLGGLEPTRAFGDARYKWSAPLQSQLSNALLPPSYPIRGPPRGLLTPPYVTAEPEVTHRKIDKTNKPQFLILATDGLWDRLSNEEAVALVGKALDGTGPLGGSKGKSIMSKSELLENVVSIKGDKQIQKPIQSSNHNQTVSESDESQYIFNESNLSTLLIKNALGGAHENQVSALLSIPAPHSRRFFDDTTVSVIILNDEDNKFQNLNIKKQIANVQKLQDNLKM